MRLIPGTYITLATNNFSDTKTAMQTAWREEMRCPNAQAVEKSLTPRICELPYRLTGKLHEINNELVLQIIV